MPSLRKMLPLPRFRVTVTDLRSGVHYVIDQRAVDRLAAEMMAVREVERLHPELTEYGTTHAVTRRERLNR